MCGFGGKLDKFRRGRYFTSQHRAQVFITADGCPVIFRTVRPGRVPAARSFRPSEAPAAKQFVQQ